MQKKIVVTNLSRYEIIKDYRKTPYQGFSYGTRSSLRKKNNIRAAELEYEKKKFKGNNNIRIQNSKKNIPLL